MSKPPTILDLYSGEGGAAMGYHNAGFRVIGVDIHPMPGYPFEFHQADALEVLAGNTAIDPTSFDAIHASPPCQGETSLKAIWQDRDHERPLIPTLEALRTLNIPWIVENVDNADAPPEYFKIRLCGSSFGLRVRRHRWFWSNMLLTPLPCDHESQGDDLVGVYGHSDGAREPGFKHPGRRRGPRQATTAEAREVMSMPWATTRRGVTNAIPPSYTEYIGCQLINHMEGTAA